MHIPSCWLRLLLLGSLCSLLLAVAPLSSNLDCPYEPLPTSLDSLSGLQLNGELHIHNQYYTPFTRTQSHTITFTLTQISDFRIYIEPHSVDIDIWLYNNVSNTVAHTSDYSLADESIYAALTPGTYRIRIFFFGNMVGTCPSMTTEISIVPHSVLQARVAAFSCPPASVYPTINPGTLTKDGFSYDSSTSDTVFAVQGVTKKPDFAFLQSYTFTLPKLLQIGDTWEVEAVLGMHFPTSALGLLLQETINPTPTDLSCYDIGNCSIASHNVRGQSTLKALVLPGTYVLWIYDVPRDRDLTITNCQPFTFSIKISHAEQEEDFLNCDGEPFPKSFAEPGIMDETGFMYYREDILIDLSVPTSSVQFTVTEDSYFRAFAVAHRIDIDLKLLNASKTLAYAYQYGSTEEAIQSFISAGNYTFQFTLFGKYSNVFCETAMLEIAIAPVSLYAAPVFDVCTGKPASAPDLTVLSQLNSVTTLNVPYAEYRYSYGSGYNQKTIVSQAFNVTVDSYLKIELGSNFLLGDVRIWLVTSYNGTTSTQLGYHRRNMHFLDVLLRASGANGITYTLTIVTGAAQSTAVVGFPACTVYSLSMSVVPANATGPQLCLSNRAFPSNLNTPQNLGTSPKIHLQEEFLIPKIDSLFAREFVSFNVTTLSYMRFYTEPHHIDIDLKLDENGTTVLQAITFNLEETIAWVLKPYTTYLVTITYYKWYFIDHGTDPCYTYAGEFSITPFTTDLLTNNCTAEKLPADFGSVVRDNPIYLEDDFAFDQGRDPADYKIKFQLTEASAFRAVVGYDFVWNDLALKLDLPGSSDPVVGELEYNKNEIGLVELGPGNYTLHIYEPFNTTNAKSLALRNCVQFHLTIGIEVIVDDEIDPLLLSCPDQYFPPTLNTPALLSALSGYNLDFNRYVLADVSDRIDQFVFNITEQSVIRLYLPVDPLLDIDVTLFKGSTVVGHPQVSYGKEELIHQQIGPGSYMVKFNYYGLQTTNILPPASACAAFRIELSIFRQAYLSNIPALSSSCDTNFLTGAIDAAATTTSFTYTRSLETTLPFFTWTFFTLRTTYLFTVQFEQVDVASGLAMLLQSTNISKTYNPLYFSNRVYLNEYLPAGTYNLSFHDPSQNYYQKCAPYQLTYTLTPSDIPVDSCVSDPLPADLFSATGGSNRYGGPQDASGYIHFFGDNFAMAKGTKNKHNYMLFNVTSKSYVRIFLALERGNSITANIYANTSLTNLAPIASTAAIGSIDRSNVWILQPQSSMYVLELEYTTISSAVDCNFFTFEFVLEPEAQVLSGLACPNPLPSEINQLPPETINLYSKQDYVLDEDDFLITSQKYLGNNRNGTYTYTMTITVTDNSTLEAMVNYDFVVNEFALVLQDATGHNITTGIHQESAETDSGFNFMNYLQWRLAPGATYKLLIVDVGIKTYNLTNFCHFFSFSLAISSVDTVAPRILQVQPSYGSDLNPQQPLQIIVTFSEPASLVPPPGESFLQYLRDGNIAYLKGSGTTSNAVVSEAYFDLSYTILTLRFEGPFGDGQAYSLALDYAKFTTRRNNTATFAAGVMSSGHNYLMHKCSGCNNRGQCAQVLGVWTCVCAGNWTGSNCEKCATGFHGAGTQCVANTFCGANTCNGHGSCSDAAGYPACACRIGYTGYYCDSCAAGFVGYPNCTSNTTDSDEDEACSAPILPTTLNTPSYLGYSNRVHLQGWYYINQAARVHEITFNLTTPSIFRVYSEPHEIDIDIWLFAVNADGTYRTVGYEISFGLEEALLQNLTAGSYMVRFRYYMWVTPSTDCATFNLELAIAPLASVLAETQATSAYCNGGLPQIAPLKVSSPYSFSQQGFAIAAPVKADASTNYFYRLNISITPPPGQVATLHATLGYRFLPGDLSILLEAGTAGTHCGNTGNTFSITPPPGCTYGDNLQNINTLHTFLEPGDYILWIYEPIRQLVNLSTCAPFDFDLTIDFVDDEQDIFSCNLPLIPLSLDSSQYTENPGFIHFEDTFVLDNRPMGFTATQPSYFRAVVTGTDVTVGLYNAATKTVVVTNGDSQNLVASLPAGSYYLQFTGDFFSFCPYVNIEFALAPATTVNVVWCPTTASTPPVTISALPYENGNVSVDYYTLNTPNTPVVARIPLRLTANAYLDTNVDSDFLFGNLRVALYDDRGLLITLGDYNYNQNVLQKVLLTGNYELRIILPPGQRVSGYPSCIKYNFYINIYYTTASSPACDANHLPTTFNSLHYLGYEGQMNYQSENWRVPRLTFATYHNVYFTVPVTSLIRVYTEPHSVDIDIKLQSGSGQILTSGSNAINTEEAFTYELQANTSYIFQLQFYNFLGVGRVPPCASFNMEIEIGPVQTRQNCPNNAASLWPTIPATLTLPWSYNSIDNGVQLYYQQQSKSTVSKVLTFTIPATANIHVEIGYDFLYGDLVLKLYSVSTKDLYLGSNKVDRNVINLINIPKGQYQLTIYEPIANLDKYLGCSNFTFSIYVEEYSALIDEERYLIEYYLPSSLDSLPYLKATNHVHLANNLFMFDGTGLHESTTFTIQSASLVRVNSMLYESVVASGRLEAPIVTITNSAGTVIASSNSSLLTTLTAVGTYTLRFAPPPSLTEQNDLGVIVSVQLAINTVANIQQEIASSPVGTDCVSSQFNDILISPVTGYYQDGSLLANVSYLTLSAGTDIVRKPFTLDRISVVYVQVGSQFLIDELEVRIYNANLTGLWHGRMSKNVNEVHQALPAGSYFVLIRQPIKQSTSVIPSHCGTFSYSFIIKDAADPGAIVPCPTLHEIPWQLDNSLGGSALFGGPIANGNLHLYGDNMHVPSQSASYINFTISYDTLVSVLIVGYPSTFTGIDLSLANKNGVSQTAVQTVAGPDRSRLSVYSLGASYYNLGINYRKGSSTYGFCYDFTLQIDIAPAATVQSLVTCSQLTPSILPSSLILNPTTQSTSDVIDSFFQGWGSVSGLTKAITFTTTKSTPIIISLSYNSLVTTFTMKLVSIKANTQSVLATAQTRGQAIKSGKTNVYLYLSTNVPAGNYSINITHPTRDSPFGTGNTVCAPFVFSYQIGLSAPARVEVTDVTPPTVDGLSTTQNLDVTVTFSNTVYSTYGSSVSSVNSSTIRNAFYLAGYDGSHIAPIFAVASKPDALQWQLTFPPLTTASMTYVLSLNPGILYDDRNTQITLPNLYRYTTINCGNNGVFDNTQGKCVCKVGYAGSNCDVCDTDHGYTAPPDAPGLCVINKCTPSTCGCRDTKCLSPLGMCTTNSSQLAHCNCLPHYTGERCEVCAPGYDGHPNCVAVCTKPCQHGGTCTTTGCQCVGNWIGDDCSTCPPQFTGSNCDRCADGYSGAKCEQSGDKGSSDWGATKTFLEVTGVLILVALAAAGAFWYWRYRRAGSRYRLVSRFNIDDDEEGGHHFPDADNRLVDDDEVEGHGISDERDEEPRVELPGGSSINSVPEPAPSNNSSRLVDM